MLEKSNVIKNSPYLQTIDKVVMQEDQAIEGIIKVARAIQNQHGWDYLPGKAIIENFFNQLPIETKSKYKDAKDWYWWKVHYKL